MQHLWTPILMLSPMLTYTVKPVLSGHSKIDNTKILKTNGILMKVEKAIISLGLLFEWPLKTGFIVLFQYVVWVS